MCALCCQQRSSCLPGGEGEGLSIVVTRSSSVYRLLPCRLDGLQSAMGTRAALVFLLYLQLTSSRVVVNNCCPNSSIILEDRTCLAHKFDPWTPAILSPSQGRLLLPGTLPDDWLILENKIPECKPSEELHFVASDIDIRNPPSFVLLDNGSLVLTQPDPDVPPNLHPDQYCINLGGCFVCVPSQGDGRALPRVKKCCGVGAVFSEVKESCKIHSQNLHVPDVTLIGGFPECPLGLTISGRLDDGAHQILPDGSLRIRGSEVTDFCIDHVFEYPHDDVHVFTCTSIPLSEAKSDIRFTLYPVGLFLSVFFLAVTLVASCLLPSTYHVLHWRCQTNHVACLMVGDLLLAVTQLSGGALEGTACVGIGKRQQSYNT